MSQCIVICVGVLFYFFHTIPRHTDTPGSVNIQIVSEDLEKDGVRVTLEWTQDNSSFYLYNISVAPNPASALTTERMRAQLKVSYDIPYNVSVQATLTRGNGNFITVSIELHYGEHIIKVTSFIKIMCQSEW